MLLDRSGLAMGDAVSERRSRVAGVLLGLCVGDRNGGPQRNFGKFEKTTLGSLGTFSGSLTV